MESLRDRFEGLPEEWIAYIEKLQERLPASQRERALSLLDRLPTVPRSLRSLFEKVNDRARAAFNEDPLEIAIIGPVNTGKSTLLNALVGSQMALVSPVPGTTREAQRLAVGPFQITDTPGMDEASGEERTRLALEAARSADLLLILFDASVGISESHRKIFQTTVGLGKPMIVAMNKIDLVREHRAEALRSARQILGQDVLPISGKTGDGLGALMKALVALDPRVVNVMTDLLPEFQLEVARQRVATSAALSAAIGWEPLPIADIIPLTAIQALMVLEIGKLYGHPVTLSRAREPIPAFAGGIAMREGFRQLSKLIPVAGDILSAGYAAAGTAAIGAAAIAWFESGGKMDPTAARRIYADSLRQFRSLLASRSAKGDGSKVERKIEEALKSLPTLTGAETPRVAAAKLVTEESQLVNEEENPPTNNGA
jgi:small GTP-binding protein